MSHLVVPDGAELSFQIMWYTYAQSVGALRLRLFKNNYTPIDASTYGDFTQADFTGYSQASPTLGTPVTVAGKATYTDTSVRSFTMGTPGTGNTVYGYYVVLEMAGPLYVLLWAERFDNPMVFANAGDQLNITLVFTLFSEY